MEIQITRTEDKILILVEGRIDTRTAPDFEKTMSEILMQTDCLKVDMQEVTYLSSAGLRVFLNAQKTAAKEQKQLVLCHVQEEVLEVFEMTGFVDILTIENS